MSELYKQIDAIFHPSSIAFVGISLSAPQHWTRSFWESQRSFDYKGGLYPVNPRGGYLDGYKVYTSVDELPDGTDYAIGTVAAEIAPDIVRKCAKRGIKAIHFCTAGFAETGEEDVAGLQQEITRLSRSTGVRIIGPNCMGLYCPESRISFDEDFPRESGHVGIISQSGGNADYVIREAGWRGVRFSKAVSFGNACDLNECDFFEYMIDDPQTAIIALYLEGVKDGQRFLRLLRRACSEKTVILVKGGRGMAGSRAAATHTASLSGNNATWDTLCRQFNLISPVNAEQLVDVLVTLTFIPDPGGRNILLTGPGGGASVLLTDEFESRGFHLPALPASLRKKLLQQLQQQGNMLQNPVDFSQNMATWDKVVSAIKLLTGWNEINFCVSFFRPSQCSPVAYEHMVSGEMFINKALEVSSKPVVFICEDGVVPERSKLMYQLRQSVIQSHKAVYYRFSDAAEALKIVIEYNERRKSS